MSNDLISRSAAIKAVDRHTTEDGKLDEDISVILEEIPTAYDVDEVCQEIKRMMFEEASIEGIKIANKAIEIVRNGGKIK